MHEVYGSAGHWHASASGFRIVAETVDLDRVKITRVDFQGVAVSRTPGLTFQIILPLLGTLARTRGGVSETIARQHQRAAVSVPDHKVDYRIENGRGLVLTFDYWDLADQSLLLFGDTAEPPMAGDLPATLDLRTPAAGALLRNAATSWDAVRLLDASGLSSLAAHGYEEVLVNLAAKALFDRPQTAQGRPDPSCGPAVVRKARDYIAANCAEALEIAKIAGDLGIPLRTLQDNFRRYYAQSPREFLLECRLERARAALSSPERAARVTDIALAAGFSDISHFAAKYFERFGEHPSATLRRAKE